MADDYDREQIKDILVRLIVEAGAEGSTLDQEDRDILIQYGKGVISRDDMINFFRDKAARIEAQRKHPQ